MKVAVEDCEGWYKDDITGAVQCADTKKYNDYMRNYRARKQKDRDFDTLQNEVSELKSELGDIKSLLLTLVKNQN
jgi:hypothetical protein|tara:strand:- start:1264 stop:1488 length:225 start_codon:yes stop_codon:yes gene_type:complete